MIKYLISIFIILNLSFGQSQRTVRRFTGTGAPGNVLASGYGDIYIKTGAPITAYICTKLVGNCNGLTSGNWLSTYNSPTTTQGDLIRRGASADERLAVGSEGALFGVISGLPAYTNISNIKMDSQYLYSVSPPSLDATTKLATMFAVQREIDAKTVGVVVGTDNGKTMVVNDSGAATVKFISRMDAFVFDGGGSVISASCSADKLVGEGAVKRFDLLSVDRTTMADVSGSATVTIYTSPSTGTTTWTSIGTASLSGASRGEIALVSSIPANYWVGVCVTGSPTSIQKLIVAPVIY